MVTENTDQLRVQPGILDIAQYKSGKSKIAGASRVVKLSSNENPFGPSPKAVEAYAAASGSLHRYPSPDHLELRAAIGDLYNLPADQLICGAGSDEIFTFICQSYAGPGDEVIVTEHGFSMHAICARAAGATPVTVREVDRRVSVEAILEAVTDATRVVFIANPGNPSGTFVGYDALEHLAYSLPQHVLLVLDGAYAEFADYKLWDQSGYDAGAALVDKYLNVIMTRTFSKVYGLGAARVGWAYANPSVIDVLNRVRGPFNVSAAGLAAAEEAIRDTSHTEHCLSENARLGAVMVQALRGMGLAVDDSFANFLLVRFADAATADAANAHLQSDGVIVRQVGGYGFPEALRITIGTQEECDLVLEGLSAFMKGQS
ncbi:MAG: histidinol-phosphate transaminase [Pseudomonadota bacterium]